MIVLDTCVLLWWTLAPEKLSSYAATTLAKATKPGILAISSITLWEIAVKCKKGKLELGMSPKEYADKIKSMQLVEIIPVDEAHWLEAVALDWAHTDHVDRVIVVSSQLAEAELITSDSEILKFYKHARWEKDPMQSGLS